MTTQPKSSLTEILVGHSFNFFVLSSRGMSNVTNLFKTHFEQHCTEFQDNKTKKRQKDKVVFSDQCSFGEFSCAALFFCVQDSE